MSRAVTKLAVSQWKAFSYLSFMITINMYLTREKGLNMRDLTSYLLEKNSEEK